MFIKQEKEFIMTLDKTVKYAGRFGDKNTNSPTGSYKNKSDSSTNDGSFLEQDWANDAYDGLNGAFLANVHDASTGQPQGYAEPTFPVEINGNVDNAQASQVYNAWYKKTQDVADSRIAAKQLEEKITELQPQFFNYYSNLDSNTSFHVNASNPSGTMLDFNKNNSGDSNASKIINANVLEIDSTDSTKININKAGIYSFNLITFAGGDATADNFAHEMLINGSAVLSLVEKRAAYMTNFSTGNLIIRNPSLNNSDTVFLRPSQVFLPELFVKVDSDNSYLQLNMYKGTGTAINYNVTFNIRRIAPLTATYTFPTDLMTDLT